jgi:5-methylcytosine-specific restriction endonuclease McrA
MPIKPENRHRYPPRKQWREIRAIILKRANHKCEFCGVPNHTVRNNAFIRLAVAHLDQQPENNHPSNLRALCEKCHLKHDAPYRHLHFRETIFKRKHYHTHDLFEYFQDQVRRSKE